MCRAIVPSARQDEDGLASEANEPPEVIATTQRTTPFEEVALAELVRHNIGSTSRSFQRATSWMPYQPKFPINR
jgi:hypothetical protein